ncbi:MAG: SDR family NAD(P)-dependent oxidoreductase [Actinomycetota bacterium]|nr:SDR family NAD(P)-dependent oxidoreductase [Actinomycetota bacterium]
MTNGKTAIVTGGSSGLGRALSAELVRAGWEVVIDGRDASAVHRSARLSGAVPFPGDVTDANHRSGLLDRQRVDLLVNNAGSLGQSPLPPLESYPLDRLRALFETNVVAPLALIQAALPQLRTSGGSVVNLTSDAAVEAYEGWGGYGMSKAALEHVNAVLAVENPGVRFWALDPGDMRTRMHQDAYPGEDISDRPAPEDVAPGFLRLLRERPPSGRIRLGDLAAVR